MSKTKEDKVKALRLLKLEQLIKTLDYPNATVLKNKLKTKDISEIYNNLGNIFRVIDDNLIFDEAMYIFTKYDSTISFFDAMYVAVSKKEGINEIVSFDSDFDKIDGIVRIH